MNTKEQIKNLCIVHLDMNPNEYSDDDYIDNLELLIQKANEYHNNGKELFPDATYDVCVDLLRELKPNSNILHSVWSEDVEENYDEDWDTHLITHPMRSIRTVKGYQDKFFTDFVKSLKELNVDNIELHASFKENGHGIRAVYSYGDLQKATSRGRSTTGRDITNQFSYFAPCHVEEWSDEPLIEVRGEVLLSFENFEKAKVFNPNIKSAFTGVASMIRASATEEETRLLNFVAYDIIGYEEGQFDTLADKYDFLTECGFEVPYYNLFECSLVDDDFEDSIREIMDYMASVLEGQIEGYTKYPYYTDGVVVSVNDLRMFELLGNEEKYNNGNVAMKIGRWEQDVYNGVIDHIEWRPGKTKFTPVAVLEGQGVMTGTGNRVRNVPLYAPLYLLLVDAYPGNTMYFKYGGEAGVIPCTLDGKLLTAFSQEEILSKVSGYAERVLDEDYDPDADLAGYDT